MVEHPHVLEQPVLVQTFITIVTVVTIEKEVALLLVFYLETGLQGYLLARKVSNFCDTFLSEYVTLQKSILIVHCSILLKCLPFATIPTSCNHTIIKLFYNPLKFSVFFTVSYIAHCRSMSVSTCSN